MLDYNNHMNNEMLAAYKAELSLIENKIIELSNIPNIILERCGDVYRIYYNSLIQTTCNKDLNEKFKILNDKFNVLREQAKVKINELEARKQELDVLITYESLNIIYEKLNTAP